MKKTNALRILDSKNIAYKTVEYSVDEEDLTGETVAAKIGAGQERVFKTLVAHGDVHGHTVFCIPVSDELDLKKCAAASGNKRVELIKLPELLPLTGYIRGGCSPVGMKKLFPTYIDETALLHETIFVSAGVRGMQMELSAEALAEVINAEFKALV